MQKRPDIAEALGREYADVKGQGAIDTLLKTKGGHVKNAFYRDDIGGIGIAWGDDDFGLQHIIKRRTEQGIDPYVFLDNLEQAIEKAVSQYLIDRQKQS